MGMMPRYRAGEKFRPRASDLNRMARVVERIEGLSEKERGPGGVFDFAAMSMQGTILARNDTEVTVSRFGAMDFGPPVIDGNENAREFVRVQVISGLPYLGPMPHGLVMVPQQPMRAGQIGRCVVAGFTLLMVEVMDERHRYATPAVGKVHMETAAYGPARILWLADPPEEEEEEEGEGEGEGEGEEEETPDIRLAFVRLGPPPREFWARIKGSEALEPGLRHLYEFEEVAYDSTGSPVEDMEEGLRKGFARNTAEFLNSTTEGIYAPGILAADNPGMTLEVKPVAQGMIVRMREEFPCDADDAEDPWERGDPPLYYFSEPGPIVGTCLAQEEEEEE